METGVQSDHQGDGGQYHRLLRGPVEEKVADGASSQLGREGVNESRHEIDRPFLSVTSVQ